MNMPWWVSAIGAATGGLATFVIAWSALKPRQRLFATRLVMRWTERAFMGLGVAYFIWMNVSFLTKDGPVGRMELWLLILVEAEAVLVLAVHLFVKIFGVHTKRESERYVRLLERIEALYSKPTTGGLEVGAATHARGE
jgi:hypothetical protein